MFVQLGPDVYIGSLKNIFFDQQFFFQKKIQNFLVQNQGPNMGYPENFGDFFYCEIYFTWIAL